MRKLQLDRETLMPLADEQLKRAVGGEDMVQGLLLTKKPIPTHTCVNCPATWLCPKS